MFESEVKKVVEQRIRYIREDAQRKVQKAQKDAEEEIQNEKKEKEEMLRDIRENERDRFSQEILQSLPGILRLFIRKYLPGGRQ